MDRVGFGQRLGKRTQQEDSLLVLRQSETDPESELVLLLADGMGGHAGGEVASQLAIDSFATHFQEVSENMRPRGRLREAMEAANAAIGARVAEEPELRGMGSTFVGALVAQGRLVWASVGDSLLYLLRGDALRRLNADHSVFGELMELVERGELTLDEARAHPKRNALRSALMGERLELIDLGAVELEPGDVVLVASDGLDTLPVSDIQRIARARAGQGGGAIVEALLDAVEARDQPRQDNVSLIAVRQPGEAVAASPHPDAARAARTPGGTVPARDDLRRFLTPVTGAVVVGAALLLGVGLGVLSGAENPQPEPIVLPVEQPRPGGSGVIRGSGITDAEVPRAPSDPSFPGDGPGGDAIPWSDPIRGPR